MKIETERLIVRPFREEDADALYRIKTDPQVRTGTVALSNTSELNNQYQQIGM